MDRDGKLTEGGVGGQGFDLKTLFAGLEEVQLRIDAIEANSGARRSWRRLPTREEIEVTQGLLDDPDPRVRELQRDLTAEIGRDINRRLDALEDALDRLTRTTIGRRRRLGLRVLQGGKCRRR